MKRNDFLKVDMKSDEVFLLQYIFIPMMLLTNVNVGSIYNGHIQMILPTLGLEHLLHLLQFLGVSRLLQSCSQSANWVIGTILHVKCKTKFGDQCHLFLKYQNSRRGEYPGHPIDCATGPEDIEEMGQEVGSRKRVQF